MIDIFAQHDRRKGAERFAELDLQVHHGLHGFAAGVAEDAAGAQGARAELHPPLKPADHLLARDQLSDLVAHVIVVDAARIDGADAVEELDDFVVGKAGTEERALL